jgi:hypothetical protein
LLIGSSVSRRDGAEAWVGRSRIFPCRATAFFGNFPRSNHDVPVISGNQTLGMEQLGGLSEADLVRRAPGATTPEERKAAFESSPAGTIWLFSASAPAGSLIQRKPRTSAGPHSRRRCRCWPRERGPGRPPISQPGKRCERWPASPRRVVPVGQHVRRGRRRRLRDLAMRGSGQPWQRECRGQWVTFEMCDAREPPICTAIVGTVAAVLALQIRVICARSSTRLDGARLTAVTAATEGKLHGTCPVGSGRPAH